MTNPAPATQKDKPRVAVFTYRYLARTMTFVHRQLLGVRDRFEPLAFATMYEDPERFPFDSVHVSKSHPLHRALEIAADRLTGWVAPPSRRQLREWGDVARAQDVRLIHAHFGPAGLIALPLARELGIPLLVLFHGYDASKALNFPAYRRQLRDLFEYAEVRAVSRHFADRLIECGADPERTGVLHCGVPIEDFPYYERPGVARKVARGQTVRYLQVASFCEKKGHRYTLEAFRRLLDVHPDSELVLVGGGELLSSAVAATQQMRMADRVRFTGWVSPEAVADHLREADVFLHHSVTSRAGDQEGIPVSMMEAMATGLPVVSTLHSGIPELVTDGENGALVAERDVDAYTERLVETLTWGPDMGSLARKAVSERFNSERVAVALGDLYASLIGRGVPG